MKRYIYSAILLVLAYAIYSQSPAPAPLAGNLWISDGTSSGHNYCTGSVQYIHDNCAIDGDIIQVGPNPGTGTNTYSWTTRITLTKAVTLKGFTTTSDTGATAINGGADATAQDKTIILCDIPKTGNAIVIDIQADPAKNPYPPSNQIYRVTGLTFANGSVCPAPPASCNVNPLINLTIPPAQEADVTNPARNTRIDHCHFAVKGRLFYHRRTNYGFVDNNVMNLQGGDNVGFLIDAVNDTWHYGPKFGTDLFFFIENNSIFGPGTLHGQDGEVGGKWVIRYNYWYHSSLSGHGTEGGTNRGQRAMEIYNNVFQAKDSTYKTSNSQRSGVILMHDNEYKGAGQPPYSQHLSDYRTTTTRTVTVWGFAERTSPWDKNATRIDGLAYDADMVNGIYPPFLFDPDSTGTRTGTASSDSVINPGATTATFCDNDATPPKDWAPDKWKDYGIKNTNPAALEYLLGSYIQSNTPNCITYNYTAATQGSPPRKFIFHAGDSYEIHKLVVMMDQNGRGKTDVISTSTGTPVLEATGRAGWAHPVLEPCYNWSNWWTTPATDVELLMDKSDASYMLTENFDYFNI